MPRHYNTSTEDLAAVSVTVTGVNTDTVDALTVNCTDVDCDTLVATTVSGNNLKISGDLHTMDGDVVVAASGSGIVLRDDNGVYWRVGVDIAGNLVTTAI